MTSEPAPVSLFYSYAHEDEPLRDELADHLKILERRGLIAAWHDRRIVPGQDWSAAIDAELERADLVLLLVSKDFVASDYIFGVELARAMQRQALRSCDVVPIIVRAVDIGPEDADFMKLQALPADLRPVTSWPNRDEAWTHVAKGLRATVTAIRARRPATAPPAQPAAAAEGQPRQPNPAAPAVGGGDIRLPPPRTAGTGVPPARPREAAPAASDPALERIVGSVMGELDRAELQRAGHSVLDPMRYELDRGARSLIDVSEWKRVLWVDDRPAGNRHEAAALAKLQIEVVEARSTTDAMARLAADAAIGEPYDLIISDWDRPGEGPDAVLRLLAALAAAGHAPPLVCYHAEFDPARRAERARRVAAAGALGEAVLPSELMALVHQALAG